jgi:hypothetical protein
MQETGMLNDIQKITDCYYTSWTQKGCVLDRRICSWTEDNKTRPGHLERIVNKISYLHEQNRIVRKESRYVCKHFHSLHSDLQDFSANHSSHIFNWPNNLLG